MDCLSDWKEDEDFEDEDELLDDDFDELLLLVPLLPLLLLDFDLESCKEPLLFLELVDPVYKQMLRTRVCVYF